MNLARWRVKDAIVAFYEKQLAEAKLEVMALEQRLEAIKNDEPAIFPVTAEEIEDINDAYVEYFGDKYGSRLITIGMQMYILGRCYGHF